MIAPDVPLRARPGTMRELTILVAEFGEQLVVVPRRGPHGLVAELEQLCPDCTARTGFPAYHPMPEN